MKRNAFLLSTMLVIAGLHTHAQGFHLGIKAGANLFKVDGESFDQQFQFGYNVGAFSQIDVTKNWGIQPEVLFNQTNYRTGNSFSSVVPDGVNDVKGKLNYLTVPVLLSYRPIPILSLLAGPQFGILLNQDEHLVNNAGDAFKKGDLSLVGGAQLNLGPLLVGARYVIGLNNINDVTNDETWRNQGWQLYAGFRLF
jgi:Outer membrane protein beta-barrel domain